tara:strand:+ start:4795 stop:6129 length:1335 start_codon:yes stop_codon:yes gene_type:complete
MAGYINTIADLEAQTYGFSLGGSSNMLLKTAGAVTGIHAGHDAATQTQPTSGIAGNLYNVLYGQKVWSMLNREVNALSVMAKRPYVSSGWRVLSKRPAGGTGNSHAFSQTGTDLAGTDAPRLDHIGGVPENASLSTSGDGLIAIAPEYSLLSMSPKTIAHQFDFSELAMEMAQIDDGIGDIRAQMREDMGKHHAEAQNLMLVSPLEAYLQADKTNAAANIERNYTSLYKVISSNGELDQMDTDNFPVSSITNDISEAYHIYGTNRDDASFLDATIEFGDGYASGDSRPFTLTLLNKLLRELRENGGSPKVILTGYDTLQTLSDLLQSQERFMDRKEIVPTVNGVRGVKGAEVGFRVATYYDIPLIPVISMQSTSADSGTISDMLVLDTDHMWLAVMKPTQYFEDGISNGNPFGVGQLGNRALYRTIAEVGCSYFKGQGKMTNLK